MCCNHANSHINQLDACSWNAIVKVTDTPIIRNHGNERVHFSSALCYNEPLLKLIMPLLSNLKSIIKNKGGTRWELRVGSHLVRPGLISFPHRGEIRCQLFNNTPSLCSNVPMRMVVVHTTCRGRTISRLCRSECVLSHYH